MSAAGIASWWHQRNPRERAMLAVMLVAVGTFVAWYGLLAPARSLRDGARQDYAAAVHGLRLVQADAARLQALANQTPPAADALAGVIEQRAAQAGLALSRQRQDSEGLWVVEMDAVDAGDLFAWLDLLRIDDGLQPVALRAERDGARLRAQASFAPAPATVARPSQP